MHAAVVAVSELCDALLADELARRLPVEWSMRDRGPRRNPAFEVDGIGDDLLVHFSTRAEAIHCAEQEWLAQFETTHGRPPTRVETTRARQHLTRATRPPKTVRPLTDLLVDWANRARALTGLEPRDLAARALAGTYGRSLHAHDIGPEVRAAMVAQVLDDVSTRRSVWTTWNLGAAAVRASKLLRMASPAERRALLNEVTADAAAACVHLDDNRDPMTRRVGESLFTSIELLGVEKALIDAAETTGAPHRPPEMLGAIPLRTEHHLGALAHDQRAAAEAVITSGRLLDVLVGPAGSGKTTTLAALTSFWGHGIGSVVGLAPSATAARALAESLGVPCETTAKWLHESTGDGATSRALRYADAVTRKASRDYREQRAANEEHWRLCAEQDQWRFSPRPARHRRRGFPGGHPHLGRDRGAGEGGDGEGAVGRGPPAARVGRRRRRVRHARPPRTHGRAHHPLAVPPAVGGAGQPRAAQRAPCCARRLRGPRRDRLRRARRDARRRHRGRRHREPPGTGRAARRADGWSRRPDRHPTQPPPTGSCATALSGT